MNIARDIILAWLGPAHPEPERSALALVRALDEAGYSIMPHEPEHAMVKASLTAMRLSRWIDAPPAEAQRLKHIIRYRAMVEYRRSREKTLPDGGRSGAAPRRAIAAVLSTESSADLSDPFGIKIEIASLAVSQL